MSSDVSVTVAETLDDETWEALAALVPQLSTTARPEQRVLAHVIAHEATTLFLARADGQVVGALTLVVYPLLTGLRAHVDDVVVDDRWRGRGIGEALVRAAIDDATRLGARTVDLTANPAREAAARLYERVGFVVRDSRLFRYEPPGPA